jgi:hypothetical protein
VTEVEAAEEVFLARRRWLPSAAVATVPGDGSFGIDVPAQGGKVGWSFGSMMLCLDGVDSAAVESVEVQSGGLRVTDFAVRPEPNPGRDGVTLLFGSEPRALAATDFGGGRTVRGRCADEDYTELAVELSRPAGGTAHADGLVVHWSSGGLRSGTVRIPGQFVLCDAATTDAPDCDPDPVQ